jgi:16S rRNA (uracil1498-N3)-methyltransferase
MTAPMFYLPHGRVHDLDQGDLIEIAGDEGRHAVAVKRLRVGEPVLIGDGQGVVLSCTVDRLVARESFFARVDGTRTVLTATPQIVVVQALIKGDRMERALETMTEAGVDRIEVWPGAHSVVRMRDEQVAKVQVKFDRRVFEASKQARRSWRPTVHLAGTPNPVVRVVQEADLAILLEESATKSLTDVLPSQQFESGRRQQLAHAEIVLIVGPEGGFSAAEREQFHEAGAMSARMGPDVLRASTAATVALGWVMGASGRWSVSD